MDAPPLETSVAPPWRYPPMLETSQHAADPSHASRRGTTIRSRATCSGHARSRLHCWLKAPVSRARLDLRLQPDPSGRPSRRQPATEPHASPLPLVAGPRCSSSGRGADGSSENESLPARTFVDLPDLAMKLASSIDSDINEASKLDGATLEKKIGSTKNTPDAAAIPAARKADVKGNVSKLEEQLREAKKKMGKENIQKAVKTAIDAAESCCF
ncbi:hypothetical protein ZWY2020_024668 [Hordeum vulgare]|nr:hypothetical protein ZWY2020_024668 [Hordeum vulgare]